MRAFVQRPDTASAATGVENEPTLPEREIQPATCACSLLATRRQALLGAGAGLGVGVGLGVTVQPAEAQSDAARLRPQAGDLLVRADSTDLSPLMPESLVVGAGQLLAVPYDPVAKLVRDGSRLNRVLLLRLAPAVMNPQTAQRSAGGVVAYSAICPHTGCEVVNWHADTQILECPCHNSQYDPKAGGRVVAGPSPRGLAALPLRLADGNLAVAQPFIGKLGIQQM
jgi:nitrite reductase/ring-hydroxylating ferredoxin subunit